MVPNYPPLEFRDPATNALTGFDIELGDAIAGKLGIKSTWQETSFDQMMPALATGRVDADHVRHDATWPRGTTPRRFVDYLRSGPQFFVQQSRAAEFKDMAALCGKNVGASRRTSFPKEIAAWSDAHCAGQADHRASAPKARPTRARSCSQGRIDAAVQGSETLALRDGAGAEHLCDGRRADRRAVHRHRASGQGRPGCSRRSPARSTR